MLDSYKLKMADDTGLSVGGLSYNDVLRWMDKRLRSVPESGVVSSSAGLVSSSPVDVSKRGLDE